MPSRTRLAAIILLPLLTLLLGWQMGAWQEERQSLELQKRMELLYTGAAGSGAVLEDPEQNVNLSLFWSVWRLLQSHYIDPAALKPDTLLLGAMDGLVHAVGDPYTVFMSPRENTDFRDSLDGHLQGIGAELSLRDGSIVVVAPIKGSPAETAGLLSGDTIIAVDDNPVDGKSLDDVVRVIRGPKGTTVKLAILRKDEEDARNVSIVRDDITVPSTEYAVRETASGSVGVLGINQFGGETIREITKTLRAVQPTKLKGLIVDLRFNGGGYLDGAVDLASMFLNKGTVVTVEGRDRPPQSHAVSGNPILPDMPLVVLINEGSASASEIVAGALQDQKRATIVGVKSFGKGTVQEVLDLPGGSSLRVTIARWLTPGGRDLSKEGVTPDIVVERTREEALAGKDPQLDAALEALLKKAEK